MQPLQEWCLECGAGQPGSLAVGGGWRAGAAILAIAALLVVGASVAAYAALTTHTRKPLQTLALHPSTAAVPPGAVPTTPGTVPTTPGATPTTPGGVTSGTSTPGLPTTGKSTPPKIPLQTATPKASGGGEANNLLFGSGSTKSSNPGSSSKPSKSSTETGKSGTQRAGSSSGEEAAQGGEAQGGETASGPGNGAEPPSPILLDTNAASTYNPYGYPTTVFGDPSLAIDGEGSTAWTAKVDPAKAPNMAEGLVLDLKTAQKLATAKAKTTTTGMTVEMYGANGNTLPASITDPAWKRLTGAKVLKKKATTLKVKTHGAAYRFVLLWIVKAPAGAASVAIDELELFPKS